MAGPPGDQQQGDGRHPAQPSAVAGPGQPVRERALQAHRGRIVGGHADRLQPAPELVLVPGIVRHALEVVGMITEIRQHGGAAAVGQLAVDEPLQLVLVDFGRLHRLPPITRSGTRHSSRII